MLTLVMFPRAQPRVDLCVFLIRLDTSGLAMLDRTTRRPGFLKYTTIIM
ncbi:MAG TPA: hypothetical protein PLP19_16985 [bacterium]|nr:hypothetical protein [bacterium]HPN45190.1 hypothetical protein [bacterium]